MAVLTFKLNEKLYLRDPQHTQLGQNIIRSSVEMIDRLGFELFTFKKLAEEIDSTEASIYRYFENKHKLLHYLVAWYWSWLDFRLDLATTSLTSVEQKLKSSIRVITEEKKYDPTFEFVNEEELHRIMISELDKTFLTKWVDNDNKAGLFSGFKTICTKISGYINELSPEYPYPNSLVSTILLGANQQLFFVEHLPGLSNLSHQDTRKVQHEKLREFIETIVFKAIAK